MPTEKARYMILVECLQNIGHHGVKGGDVTVNMSDDEILVSNFVLNSEMENLKQILDEVNTSDLKKLYREKLTNKTFSDKGTAGLGLIYIARKSNQKLKYDFQPFNDLYSTFTLQVAITSNTYQTTRPSSHGLNSH